jgi:hypothetical protein
MSNYYIIGIDVGIASPSTLMIIKVYEGSMRVLCTTEATGKKHCESVIVDIINAYEIRSNLIICSDIPVQIFEYFISENISITLDKYSIMNILQKFKNEQTIKDNISSSRRIKKR